MLNSGASFTIYVILVIVLIAILKYLGVSWWGAIVLAALVGWIFLLIVIGGTVFNLTTGAGQTFSIITIITLILVLIYVAQSVWLSRKVVAAIPVVGTATPVVATAQVASLKVQ